VTFPPGMRRIDPDAEAARLAEERKGGPDSARASFSCEEPDCGSYGDATGTPFIAQMAVEVSGHAVRCGHRVRVEVWAESADG
jgi:hypothetical protein